MEIDFLVTCIRNTPFGNKGREMEFYGLRMKNDAELCILSFDILTVQCLKHFFA